MLPIVIGLGSIAGLFCLWLFRDAERTAKVIGRTRCPVFHRVGKITVRHHLAINCQIAEEVAAMARVVWWEWIPEFPGKSERFTLLIIFDKNRDYGDQSPYKVFVNLADWFAEGEGFEREAVWDTLAEELHHLYEWWVYGQEAYVFKPRTLCGHEEVIVYYALNGREYRGLCFAVVHVGRRAQLLEEVEAYRALHGSDS